MLYGHDSSTEIVNNWKITLISVMCHLWARVFQLIFQWLFHVQSFYICFRSTYPCARNHVHAIYTSFLKQMWSFMERKVAYIFSSYKFTSIFPIHPSLPVLSILLSVFLFLPRLTEIFYSRENIETIINHFQPEPYYMVRCHILQEVTPLMKNSVNVAKKYSWLRTAVATISNKENESRSSSWI